MSSQFKVCFSPKRTKDSVCVERLFNRREPSAEPTLWRPLSWMSVRSEREKSMSYFFPTCQNKSVLVCSVWVLLCEAWRRDRGHSGQTGLCKATPTLLSWLRHQRGYSFTCSRSSGRWSRQIFPTAAQTPHRLLWVVLAGKRATITPGLLQTPS